MNRAIVILFTGNTPTNKQIKDVMHSIIDAKICIPEMLEVKVLDSDAIAQAIVGSSYKNTSEQIPLETSECISKLAVIKAVKTHLRLSIEEAKKMVDDSDIIIPDLSAKISFLKELADKGSYPTLTNASTDEIMAKMASGIFLSKQYGKEGKIKLITDYLTSNEKPESLLSASEKALRETIAIVSKMSEEEAKAFGVPCVLSKTCRELVKLI